MKIKSRNDDNPSRRDFIKKSLGLGIGLSIGSLYTSDGMAQNQHGVLSDKAKKLLGLFNLKYPIIQAPTAGPAGNELAIAVANTGAMGALPLTWHSVDDAIQSVKQVKSGTQGAFFVNYVLSLAPKSLEAVLEVGAKIIQFSWGLPSDKMVENIRSAGARLGLQVTSKQNAQAALQFSPDYLVCQGIEAGGHVQASKKTFRLL